MKNSVPPFSRDVATLVVLSVIWGLAFVAIRRADLELSPINLTLARWLLVSASFLVISPIMRRPFVKLERKDVPRLLLASFASVGGYHLSLNYAETVISSGLAGLLVMLWPVFAVTMSTVFLKERVSWKLVVALALALMGGVVLSLSEPDFTFQNPLGPIAGLIAAFMSAVFAVASKPLVEKYGALSLAVWVALIGTAMLFPLLSGELVVELHRLSVTGWVSVLYLALLSTVLANIMYYTLIATHEVSTLSVQLYVVPVVSVAGGALLLSEPVSLLMLAGGGLLLAGVMLSTKARRRIAPTDGDGDMASKDRSNFLRKTESYNMLNSRRRRLC
jgi:drug/metabolite transporter (DMT)-like permease